MKTLQAGDKAVLYYGERDQDIIAILEIKPVPNIVRIKTSKGEYETVAPFDLQPVYIVRVLQGGRAREVNPLGELILANGSDRDTRRANFESQKAWREAESQCLTLPCDAGALVYKSDAPHPVVDQLYYALLSSDKFTLIKPKTD